MSFGDQRGALRGHVEACTDQLPQVFERVAVSADEAPPHLGGKLETVAAVRIANQFEPRCLGIDDQPVEVEYQSAQSHRRSPDLTRYATGKKGTIRFRVGVDVILHSDAQ